MLVECSAWMPRLRRRCGLFGLLWMASCASLFVSSDAWAQRKPVHYFHRADLPPGTVGKGQLLRGGPLAGYFQPVRIQAPDGSLISLAAEGSFQPGVTTVVQAGMQIGCVYRFKVGNIPGHPNAEVFPSIEVINRLHPPAGQAAHYPIPIDVTQDELEMAIRGAYVTRVIYLEHPDRAYPIPQEGDQQRYFDVSEATDPLQVADELGRPMAILRMGSRTAEVDPLTGQLPFETPPLMLFPQLDFGESVRPGEPAEPSDPTALRTVPGSPTLPNAVGQPALNQVDSPSRRTVLEAYRANIPRIALPPNGFTSGGDRATLRR